MYGGASRGADRFSDVLNCEAGVAFLGKQVESRFHQARFCLGAPLCWNTRPPYVVTKVKTMGKKKRHTREEVGAKLAQAEKLEAEGKLQNDIARSLGVSVMTLHRWRKMPAGSREMTAGLEDSVSQSRSEPAQVDDLKLENSRLRRLVRPSLLNICEHTVQP